VQSTSCTETDFEIDRVSDCKRVCKAESAVTYQFVYNCGWHGCWL